MGVDAKKKNNNFSSTVNVQSHKSRSKAGENDNKKDDHGKKRKLPTENANEKKELQVIKSVMLNSVTFSVNRALGHTSGFTDSKFQKTVIMNQLRRFKTHSTLNPFGRRLTAIAWHPKYPQISVAGSRGGELILHNLINNEDYFIPEVGNDGSILGLKCNDKDPYTVYTASMTGRLLCEDFHRKNSRILFSLPLSWDNWFTSLGICYNRQLLMSGDCRGNCYLVSASGKPVWRQKKLHNSKITHCEFNIHDPNIFVTASVDRSVKLWDLRCLSESKTPKPVWIFPHSKPVNSAYFSPSNGLNLLTTDQHSELRIYSSPCWNETLSITHPHRKFRHITDIKAVWHPVEDIIIVGRYPDDTVQTPDERTIDFYDGSNGKLLHKIASPTGNIISLNAVNSTGDTIASTTAYSLIYLKDENIVNGVSSKHDSDDESENIDIFKKKKKKKEIKDARKIKSRKDKTLISL